MNVNVAWLTTNRNCNLACKWCYAQDFFDVGNSMELGLAKSLIDISIKAGVKKFFLIGGEPTVYPKLFDVIGYITSYNVEAVVVTNGVSLGNIDFCEKVQKLNYTRLHFGISLKGSSENEYIQNCGGKGFEAVLNGISNCEKYGFTYSLSYVLTTENVTEIDLFAKRIADSGIQRPISFQICNDVISHDGAVIENSEHPLKIDRMFGQKYNDVCNYLNNGFYLHQILPLCQCDQSLLSKMISENQVTTACHVHERNGVIFDIDGSLLLCNHLAGFSFGEFGKDFRDYESFCLYWDSDPVKDLHRKLTTMPTTDCKDCEMASRCGGGCCIQWFSKDFESFKNYSANNLITV